MATGSSSIAPSIEGIEDIDYLTNDSLFKGDLPQSHTIIGGGYSRLEIAEAYQRFGSK
ncbi:FAD-dependent oxidoreductase [Christiangramia sp.]|uniref:FAD-dependent oxidoreductase n=1 Tax=Christiangramia sp. TaxID=1931228 RepID=UPI00345C31D6